MWLFPAEPAFILDNPKNPRATRVIFKRGITSLALDCATDNHHSICSWDHALYTQFYFALFECFKSSKWIHMIASSTIIKRIFLWLLLYITTDTMPVMHLLIVHLWINTVPTGNLEWYGFIKQNKPQRQAVKNNSNKNNENNNNNDNNNNNNNNNNKHEYKINGCSVQPCNGFLTSIMRARSEKETVRRIYYQRLCEINWTLYFSTHHISYSLNLKILVHIKSWGLNRPLERQLMHTLIMIQW